MSFIETIPEQYADADVLAMYERQSSFFGYLPNYARVFSHRPEVMRLWADLQNGVRSGPCAAGFALRLARSCAM